MTIKANVKLDMNFPKFNFQKDIKVIADRIIVPDIVLRMNKEIDIDGSPHPTNKASTKRYKTKRGLKNKTLIASGQLRKSFKVAEVRGGAVIFPSGVRKPYPALKGATNRKSSIKNPSKTMTNFRLAKILQVEGIKNGHKYEFFGISDRAEKNALAYMRKQIAKAIKRG